MTMNKDVIEGNWKQLQGKIQQQWGKLTNDKLHDLKGSAKELEGALQKEYGYDKEKAKEQIDQFIKKNDLH